MSNLTDFFPAASGGGDSAIVTDPSKLTAVSSWSDSVTIKYTNALYYSNSSGFWDNLEKAGTRAVITAANVYTTIVDITGSGHFYYSVSPGGSGISTVTARFTVDGVVTEIPMTVNRYSSTSDGRAIIGPYTAGSSGSTSTMVGWNQNQGDYGHEVNRTYFEPASSENYQVRGIGLLRPDFFLFHGAPKLRFETDFKLEYKTTAFSAASYRNFTGAVYKLD
jgi:hypothetical protein